MIYSAKKINSKEKKTNDDNYLEESVKILSEFTKSDIEKSYKLDIIKGTEAYFSNRYGWTLRKSID